MLRAFATPLLGLFYDVLVPNPKKTLTERFVSFLHAVVVTCLLIMFSHQVSQLGDHYAYKCEEYLQASILYKAECPYNGASAARRKECSELNIIINSWPTIGAVSLLVKGLNSGLFELYNQIVSAMPYKIAFALFTLGVASYCLNFFKCATKKSKEYIDKHRLKETNKAVASMHDLLQKQASQQFGFSK